MFYKWFYVTCAIFDHCVCTNTKFNVEYTDHESKFYFVTKHPLEEKKLYDKKLSYQTYYHIANTSESICFISESLADCKAWIDMN